MKKERPHIIRWLFRQIFILLNIVAVLWLVLCGLAAVVHPSTFKYLSIFSLTVPFAVVANAIFVIFWLLSSKKIRCLLSFVALAICYKVSFSFFGFNYFTHQDFRRDASTIKIVSWNTHGMGIFNRPRDKKADEEMRELIRKQDADIICLMEYPTPRDDFMNKYTRQIINGNNYTEFRFKDDNVIRNMVYLGTAIFSKYRFKNYAVHQLSDDIYMVQGDVTLANKQTVRMFFVHLNTFGLTDKDKAYIETVKKSKTVEDKDIDSSKSYASKFDFAFKRRAIETDKAVKIIAESPHPVLVCGDFNDLPGSYTYTQMRKDLKDVFLEKGKGLGRTYNMILPTLRIDYMLYDPSVLKPVGFQIYPTNLSDHRPLITNFEIIPKP